MADSPIIELTAAWVEKIHTAAPATPVVKPESPRRILMFSECVGYVHWVIPHTSAVIKTLAEKSAAFEVVETDNAEDFNAENLKNYDAVLLNNTCSIGGEDGKREMFSDFVEDEALALELKNNVMDFVRNGGGYIAIHGGGLAYLFCPEWEAMQGATFDFHPPQQEVRLKIVEPDHPLLRAFEG
ncbi:MAG: ThuA domain-containing protein, partial [Lentisphaeria bacterium]|nr:ThuA domain-containing protein [Lentisphaeria bacterium]